MYTSQTRWRATKGKPSQTKEDRGETAVHLLCQHRPRICLTQCTHAVSFPLNGMIKVGVTSLSGVAACAAAPILK